MSEDRIYARPQKSIQNFQFDETVTEVFDDMIQRSVPAYQTIITMIGSFAAQFVQKNSHCYDLGCSLGAATQAIYRHINVPNCHIFAIDNSTAMLTQCKKNLSHLKTKTTITLHYQCMDINQVNIHNASMIILNFTLQFIPLAQRSLLLEKIYQGLLPGGVLILSEKIQFNSATKEHWNSEMYYNFKKAQGYSELEISQKRTALERVLIPETLHNHYQRLQQVGFSKKQIHTWLQCLNFTSLLAIK